MGFRPVDGWLVVTGTSPDPDRPKIVKSILPAICFSSASMTKHLTLQRHHNGCFWFAVRLFVQWSVQGYLAYKKTPTPIGPPQDPGHRPTVGLRGCVFL